MTIPTIKSIHSFNDTVFPFNCTKDNIKCQDTIDLFTLRIIHYSIRNVRVVYEMFIRSIKFIITQGYFSPAVRMHRACNLLTPEEKSISVNLFKSNVQVSILKFYED